MTNKLKWVSPPPKKTDLKTNSEHPSSTFILDTPLLQSSTSNFQDIIHRVNRSSSLLFTKFNLFPSLPYFGNHLNSKGLGLHTVPCLRAINIAFLSNLSNLKSTTAISSFLLHNPSQPLTSQVSQSS